MIKFTNLLALISLLVFNNGCATHSKNQLNQQSIEDATLGDISMKSDPFTISSVTISGKNIEISISFSGGCNEHNFKLVGSEAISKSLPPQRSIVLIHQNNADTCKKLVEKKLIFNIEAFSYQKEKGSIINLNLSGWKERIEFIYP
jgi:hypothetical protein